MCARACMTSCARLTIRLRVSEVESNNSPVCVFFDLCTQHLHLLPCVRFGKLTYSFRRRAQIEHVNSKANQRTLFSMKCVSLRYSMCMYKCVNTCFSVRLMYATRRGSLHAPSQVWDLREQGIRVQVVVCKNAAALELFARGCK